MPRNSVPPDGLDDSVIPELAPIAGSTDGRLEKHLASPPFVSTTDNDITAGSRVQTRNSHIARDEKKNPQRLASIESCCAVDPGTLAKLSFTSATGARSRLLRLRETRFNWPSDPQLSNLGCYLLISDPGLDGRDVFLPELAQHNTLTVDHRDRLSFAE